MSTCSGPSALSTSFLLVVCLLIASCPGLRPEHASHLYQDNEVDLLEGVEPEGEVDGVHLAEGSDGFPAIRLTPDSRVERPYKLYFKDEFYQAFSIQAHFKLDQPPGGFLFSIIDPLEQRIEMGLEVEGGPGRGSNVSLHLGVEDGAAQFVHSFQIPVEAGSWTRISISVLRETVSLYLDCELQETASLPLWNYHLDQASLVYLGQAGTTFGKHFHGVIERLKLFGDPNLGPASCSRGFKGFSEDNTTDDSSSIDQELKELLEGRRGSSDNNINQESDEDDLFGNRFKEDKDSEKEDQKALSCCKELAETLRGIPGPPGEDGEAGPRGEDGFRGAEGPPGPRGVDGLPGAQGPPGPKGDTGATGLPGASLPLYSEEIIDEMVRKSVEAMKSSLKGDRGEDGRRGEMGPEGAAGPDGLQGQPGRHGEKGEPGGRGESGTDGLPGLPGVKGEQGERGPPGESSSHPTSGEPLPGEKGERGVQGPPGPPGPQGTEGGKGEKGSIGEKGDRGRRGPRGLPGPPGPSAPIYSPIKGKKGDAGETKVVFSAGPAGPPGPPGSPGLSFVGEKGEPGEPSTCGHQPISSTHRIRQGRLAKTENYYQTEPGVTLVPGAITFQNIKLMSKMTSSTRLGTMAYIMDEEAVLVRTGPGWQYVALGPVVTEDDYEDPSSQHNDVNDISATPPQLPSNTPSLRLAALDEVYSGNAGGSSGADKACYTQAKQAGLSNTFRAFLATNIQNLDSIVQPRDRSLPVVNIKGEVLFESWLSMFSGIGGRLPTASHIYSFSGKHLLSDPTWPEKLAWHGGMPRVDRSHRQNCNSWKSDVRDRVGLATSLTPGHRLLAQRPLPCSHRLAVLCVEVSAENHSETEYEEHGSELWGRRNETDPVSKRRHLATDQPRRHPSPQQHHNIVRRHHARPHHWNHQNQDSSV